MKKIDYDMPGREGTLHLTVSDDTEEAEVIRECNASYSAWKDTDENDDSYEPLPDYIGMCLNDNQNICLVMLNYEERKKLTPTELFDEFLDLTEFTLVKYPDGWGLIDHQDGNLGNIENDRFRSAEDILERMDSYIHDYIVEDLEEAIEGDGIEYNDYEDLVEIARTLAHPDYDTDIDILDMICHHLDEVDLEKAVHIEEELSVRFDTEWYADDEMHRVETYLIKIKKSELKVYEDWLKEKPFHLRKHGVPKFGIVASWTAKFQMGIQADLKICSGTEEDTLWTEMVLFNRNGEEIACTECEETLLTDWELGYDDVIYRIKVEEEE